MYNFLDVWEMKALSYSYVKYSPRVPLLRLTVKKIERESFDFVLLLLLLSSSFPSRVTRKYKAYTNEPHTFDCATIRDLPFLG